MANELFSPERFTLLDGALGTMLQAAGMAPGQSPERFGFDHPQVLYDIERAYVEAGANVLIANTFGANEKKLAGSGLTVEQAVQAAMLCALKAADGKALVALDMGPLGEMLQPGGTLSFEEAYALFARQAVAGQAAGAGLVVAETMTDLLELKAAVLAVREHTNLPVLASMTFEADGRTFTGVSVEGFAASIEGLGVAGLGLNCSLGPSELMPLVRRLCAATQLPVFVQPNAGLPDPATGEYHFSPAVFCEALAPCAAMGVAAVGGCCGTTPEFIRQLKAHFSKLKPAARIAVLPARVCGATRVATLDRPLVIGERINPTGKKRLREALQAGDIAAIQALAVEQERAGADILDVNVGAPGVDEVAMLPAAVRAVQAVSGLPLQLDSANPKALAAALRVCCGRPVVNSTSGEAEKMAAVLPLCRQYGAAVVGLALDEAGIPQTAQGRLMVAKNLQKKAREYGLRDSDLIIDCLTLSAGAQPEAAAETLKAIALVKEKLSLKTVLGVSNVSFGLPQRPLLNRTFLAMALQAGLDFAILNPADEAMMGTMAAHRLLAGYGGGADAYVARCGDKAEQNADAQKTVSGAPMPLDEAIEKGLAAEAARAAACLIEQGEKDSLLIVDRYMIPALDKVGQGFEQKRVFLPQLLSAAAAAQAAFEVLRGAMGEAQKKGPPVVVATVQGDVHDIGKNIAKVLLQNYGFTVTDLGRDVPPQAVADAVQKTGAKLVGLSALMTTTLPAMEATITALHAACPSCKILVGGAVLTEEYAQAIGADFYAKDATASADYARRVHAKLA